MRLQQDTAFHRRTSDRFGNHRPRRLRLKRRGNCVRTAVRAQGPFIRVTGASVPHVEMGGRRGVATENERRKQKVTKESRRRPGEPARRESKFWPSPASGIESRRCVTSIPSPRGKQLSSRLFERCAIAPEICRRCRGSFPTSWRRSRAMRPMAFASLLWLGGACRGRLPSAALPSPISATRRARIRPGQSHARARGDHGGGTVRDGYDEAAGCAVGPA
jgi:hypothetical protein